MTIYQDLLGQWCDALLTLQVRQPHTPGLFGGILCPACARIHGRCADAIYPLLRQARSSGDSRYIQAAVDLQAWSDHVSLPDGSWVNEPTGHEWKGITVFGAVALGEALRHHGDLLGAPARARWRDRLRRAADFLMGFATIDAGVINYPVTAAAALALAGAVVGEPRYTARARQLAHETLAYFSQPSRLLFGEGRPTGLVSPKGCRPVDLAYNVEESLPNLAVYAAVTGDAEVRAVAIDSLRQHLEFMLPDGAWDDSWATRQFKWAYWGSRTSDGCQTAMALLADADPAFAVAAFRNAQLLQACTHAGLLYGGPHYVSHGEPPCAHHTFCHAKAMASAIDYGLGGPDGPTPRSPVALPRDERYGVKYFPEIATHLEAVGPWRATVTGYDWVYLPQGHASGGALTMLWHEGVGPVIAASMNQYTLTEPSNMQPDMRGDLFCLTPRIELAAGGETYTNLHDLTAELATSTEGDRVTITAQGRLLDQQRRSPAGGDFPFTLAYKFDSDRVGIEVSAGPAGSAGQISPAGLSGENRVQPNSNDPPQADTTLRPGPVVSAGTDAPGRLASPGSLGSPDARLNFIIPLICAAGDKVEPTADGVTIHRPAGQVRLTVTGAKVSANPRRGFNHVPGFEAVELVIPLPVGEGVTAKANIALRVVKRAQ